MFEKLENRFFFTGEILLLNEFHIGSGKGDVRTDALVIKDNRNKPFIPGSSLRGALRSTIERIVNSIGLNPCLLINGNDCITTSEKIQDEFKQFQDELKEMCLFNWDKISEKEEGSLIRFLKYFHNLEWVEDAKISKSDDGKTILISKDENLVEIVIDEREDNAILKISDDIIHNLKVKKENGKINIYKREKSDFSKILSFLSDKSKVCPVCQLFGSTVFASKIRITDLSLINNNYKYSIRDGVAIDRDTETAKDQAKFDFETVSKDTRFKFELIGENLTQKDLQLLAVGIQELENGNFWLGANSSRGLGRCKLEGLKIRCFVGADGLKKYLIKKKDRYLFSWDMISGNDNEKLKEFLNQNYSIDWVETAEIEAIDDNKAIKVFTDKNSILLRLNDENTKVNLKIDDKRTDTFFVEAENDKLNIYDKNLIPVEKEKFYGLVKNISVEGWHAKKNIK